MRKIIHLSFFIFLLSFLYSCSSPTSGNKVTYSPEVGISLRSTGTVTLEDAIPINRDVTLYAPVDTCGRHGHGVYM